MLVMALWLNLSPLYLLDSKMNSFPVLRLLYWGGGLLGEGEVVRKEELPLRGAPHYPPEALAVPLSVPRACYLLLQRACRYKNMVGMEDPL